MSILLRLWDLHHVNTKVQASFIHSCLRILKDKELLRKISQVNKDGKNCKINYDHQVLINLPGDGVFFKVHLTIKQITITRKCVFGISLEQLQTVFRSNLACQRGVFEKRLILCIHIFFIALHKKLVRVQLLTIDSGSPPEYKLGDRRFINLQYRVLSIAF